MNASTAARLGVVLAVLMASAGCDAPAATPSPLEPRIDPPDPLAGTGTYHAAGVVSIAGVPSYATSVAGARVEVTGGTGSGLTALTDEGGSFGLRGVAGEITVAVTRDGFRPSALALTVTEDTSSLILPLSPAGPVPAVAGIYALTLRAAADCPASSEVGALPDAVRTRRYTAAIAQDGNRLDVKLSGARFLTRPDDYWKTYEVLGDGFPGYVTPETMVFVLRGPRPGDDPGWTDPFDLSELVDGVGHLRIEGMASVTTGRAPSGTLSGSFALTGEKLDVFCQSDRHTFTLSR